MAGKTIYPSIPAPGNTQESQRATLDAVRQTLTMITMNAQNPNPNFAPSTAAQIFVTKDELKSTGVVGAQGPAGPQGPPGPGIDEAPNDVNTYGRHALTWQPVLTAINYSLTEQYTGLKWIDGKKIYQKTIQCVPLANSQGFTDTLHNIANMYAIVGFDAILAIVGGGSIVATPPAYTDYNPGTSMGTYATETYIRISVGQDRSAFTYNYVTLRYTCTDR